MADNSRTTLVDGICTLASRLRRLLAAPGAGRPGGDEARWRCDPLSHPALARMSARDLDDLPLDRTLFGGGGDDGLCRP